MSSSVDAERRAEGEVCCPCRSSGGGMGEPSDGYRYRAFISYSWVDAKWGKWLQHAIETYRTPKALIGEDRGHGPVLARLHPLFKDREEEAAGSSIGAAVEAALADSAFLIVICSPNSAKSQWVNREVAWFKTHRDPARVLALIVGGEPGDPANECFPRALTHRIADDLTITDIPEDAPLAADARDSGDGKRMAKLKLAAAMLGVGLDELVRRDERRRTLRTRAAVTASLTLAAVMSTLTWFAVEARKEAEFQRNQADGLVEFMLTDLRDKLEPVGRLDALDVVGTRALDYYAKQKLGDLDADALGRRARALLLVGELSNLRGDSGEALKAFTEAAASTAEQLARDPDNPQRIFDHAQSVFWVGYIAYNRGEVTNAEAQFREYKRLADRLLAIDPKNPEWQMESSYAESNLGVMLNAQGRHAESEPAFAASLTMAEASARGRAFDADRQIEIGNAANWLGVAKDKLGKLAEARALHAREIAIYEEVLRRDPDNAVAKNRLGVALQFLASLELQLGDSAAALQAYDRSLAVHGELLRIEPANTEWQQSEVGGRIGKANTLIALGRLGESRALLEGASAQIGKMIAMDPANAAWSAGSRFDVLRIGATLALVSGRAEEAKAPIAEAIALVARKPDPTDHATALLFAGDIEARLGAPEAARDYWTGALAILPAVASTEDERFMLLKRLGRSDEAARLAAALDRRGYRDPAYLREKGL
ncbi:MAG: TIR domain-containing protein [Porphyrobacter sp. IPPAS B-1204]|nr:MAG: TIR domain-containing protein [Porphyrobacter sp. IPPAS B-1204]